MARNENSITIDARGRVPRPPQPLQLAELDLPALLALPQRDFNPCVNLTGSVNQ